MHAIEGFCKIQKHRINLKTIIKRFVPHVVHKHQLGYTRTPFHETMLPAIKKWWYMRVDDPVDNSLLTFAQDRRQRNWSIIFHVFLSFSLAFALKTGVMLALFQIKGTSPKVNDRLNRWVKGHDNSLAYIFKIRAGIPSTPELSLFLSGGDFHKGVWMHHVIIEISRRDGIRRIDCTKKCVKQGSLISRIWNRSVFIGNYSW